MPFERKRAGRLLPAWAYDGDLMLPERFLVDLPAIDRTLGEFCASNGVYQFARSETQGARPRDLFLDRNVRLHRRMQERYLEVPSDVVPFEQRPWMKAAEITDALIDQFTTMGLAWINFANGDMVGHTGVFEAARMSVEAVDPELGRLLETIDKIGGIARSLRLRQRR